MLTQINESIKSNNKDETKQSGLMAEQKFSLYVRGSAWIKDRENAVNRLKEIEPRIHNVRHPRQKSADYCFIDFESALDRDQSYEKLNNHAEITVKRITKDIPKLLEKRRQKIAEKREAKKETRKLIAHIKKKEKLNAKSVEKTNQIVVVNLPAQVTLAELKEQYSSAITVNLKTNKKHLKSLRTAIITFPNPYDAYAATKESVSLHGQKIDAVLNTIKLFKQKTNNYNKKKLTKKKSHKDGNKKSPKKWPKTGEKIEK